jgi:hypothetical protein
MGVLRILLVVPACVGVACSTASAGPARFWISANPSPTGWEAPTINASVGQPQTLYIWMQPATDGNGMPRTLTNFSLDVVTRRSPQEPEPQPFVDFVNGSFLVYNNPFLVPGQGMKTRFEYTFDSQTDSELGGPLTSGVPAASSPDAINGLLGLTIDNSGVIGIGNASDPYRVTTTNPPSFRVAEFSFVALSPQPMATTTNDLYLQIGWAGMSHSGGQPPDAPTQVVFGNNSSPVYTAGPGTSHRRVTLSGDTYDIRINAITGLPGDFNEDDKVDAADYVLWRKNGNNPLPNDGGAANSAARFTLWKANFGNMQMPGGGGVGASDGADGTASRLVIPEPTSAALLTIGCLWLAARPRRRRRT